MGCIQAPDRDLEKGQLGTHKYVIYDRRAGQPMNPNDARRLSDWAVQKYGTNLYRCEYCGEIEAM